MTYTFVICEVAFIFFCKNKINFTYHNNTYRKLYLLTFIFINYKFTNLWKQPVQYLHYIFTYFLLVFTKILELFSKFFCFICFAGRDSEALAYRGLDPQPRIPGIFGLLFFTKYWQYY